MIIEFRKINVSLVNLARLIRSFSLTVCNHYMNLKTGARPDKIIKFDIHVCVSYTLKKNQRVTGKFPIRLMYALHNFATLYLY